MQSVTKIGRGSRDLYAHLTSRWLAWRVDPWLVLLSVLISVDDDQVELIVMLLSKLSKHEGVHWFAGYEQLSHGVYREGANIRSKSLGVLSMFEWRGGRNSMSQAEVDWFTYCAFSVLVPRKLYGFRWHLLHALGTANLQSQPATRLGVDTAQLNVWFSHPTNHICQNTRDQGLLLIDRTWLY